MQGRAVALRPNYADMGLPVRNSCHRNQSSGPQASSGFEAYQTRWRMCDGGWQGLLFGDGRAEAPCQNLWVDVTGGAHAKRSRPNSSRKPGTIARFVRSLANVDRRGQERPSRNAGTVRFTAPPQRPSQSQASPTPHASNVPTECVLRREAVSFDWRENWKLGPGTEVKVHQTSAFRSTMPNPCHRATVGCAACPARPSMIHPSRPALLRSADKESTALQAAP